MPQHTTDVRLTKSVPEVPQTLHATAGYAWRLIVIVFATALVIWGLAYLFIVTMPIILALILATIFIPAAEWLERRGIRPAAAGLLVMTGAFVGFGLLIAFIAPSFGEQLPQLVEQVQAGLGRIQVWAQGDPLNLPADYFDQLGQQGTTWLEANRGQLVGGLVTGATIFAQVIAALALMIVLLFFIVKDRDVIVNYMETRLPAASRETTIASAGRAWHALSGYVRGTALIAAIDAVLIGVALAIFKIPLALPIALLVFFGAFLPVIGALITGSLAILVGLADGGVSMAAIAAVIVLIVQQIEGNVLQPMIMQRSINLHPTVVLVALAAGAAVAGIAGAFLSVPVVAVAAAVGNELRLRRLAETEAETAAANA